MASYKFDYKGKKVKVSASWMYPDLYEITGYIDGKLEVSTHVRGYRECVLTMVGIDSSLMQGIDRLEGGEEVVNWYNH